MDEREQKAVIEGLLFLWGDPLEVSDIAKILGITPTQTKKLMQEMEDEFEHQRRGLVLHAYGDAYQLSTRKEHEQFYAELVDRKRKQRLTGSSMETLAMIAYKQPITKVEVDNIRGVKSSSSFETLLSKGLIEEAGRLDKIGRPILYRTTSEFLKVFGLRSLKDLPNEEEVTALLDKFDEEGSEDED